MKQTARRTQPAPPATERLTRSRSSSNKKISVVSQAPSGPSAASVGAPAAKRRKASHSTQDSWVPPESWAVQDMSLDLDLDLGRDHDMSPSMPVDVLDALARLQSFDGCFSAPVLKLVKAQPSDLAGLRAALALPASVSDGAIYSLLAIVYLDTKLQGVERDAWEGMYEKGRNFVADALTAAGVNENIDDLKARAGKLLA